MSSIFVVTHKQKNGTFELKTNLICRDKQIKNQLKGEMEKNTLILSNMNDFGKKELSLLHEKQYLYFILP